MAEIPGEELTSDELNFVYRGVSGKNPDRFAEARRIAEEYEAPPELIERNLEEAKRRREADRFDPDSLIANAPKTAEFLRSGENMAVAHDSVDELGSFEVSDSLLETAAKGILDQGLGIAANLKSFDNWLGSTPAMKYHPLNIARGWISEKTGVDIQENLERSKEAIGFKPTMDIDQILEDPSFANIGTMIAEQGPGAAVWMASFAMSAPATYISLLEGIAQERAQNENREEATLEDRLKAAPAVIASYYLERFALDKIAGAAGRKLMGRPSKADLDKPVGKYATKLPPPTKLQTAGKVVGGGIKGTVLEGTTESIQGGIEYLGAALGTEKGATLEDFGKQALAEGLIGGPLGGVVKGATTYADIVADRTESKIRNSVASSLEASNLDQWIELAQNGTLAKRSPEAFADFVGTNRAVFADQDAVQELLDAGVELPPDVTNQLDGNGGRVSILMRDFLRNPEMAAKLKDRVALREDGMTRKQMTEDNAEDIAALVRQAEENVRKDAESEQILADITESLVATQRMRPSEARQNAMIMASQIRTRAGDYGMTPREFYDKYYRLKIEGPERVRRAAEAPPGMDVQTARERLSVAEAALREAVDTGADTTAAQRAVDAARAAVDSANSPLTEDFEAQDQVQTLLDQQDFGDLRLEEEREVADTGEVVVVSKPAQKEWDTMTKRRGVVVKLKECLNA